MLSEQQETVDHLVEEIKNFNEVELQKIMPDDSDSANKYKSLYEFKLESMNLWKKTLEADLAASRSIIKTQKALIDRMRVENITTGTDPMLQKKRYEIKNMSNK